MRLSRKQSGTHVPGAGLALLLFVSALVCAALWWVEVHPSRGTQTSLVSTERTRQVPPNSGLLIPVDFSSISDRESALESHGVLAVTPTASLEEESRMVSIRCVAEGGLSVEGVRLLVTRGTSEWTELGETDADGRLAVVRELVTDAELVPRRGDLAASPCFTDQDVPEVLTIHVFPSAGIQGVVRLPDGSAAGAGIRVLALPDGHPRGGSEEVTRALAADLCATTDGEGVFRIRNLTPGCSYRISAAGRGLMCAVSAPIVAPHGNSVVLQAQYVYGARVTFETGGGRLADLPDQAGVDHSPVTCEWSEGVLLRQGVVRRTLLGVEAQVNSADNPSLFLFRSEVEPWRTAPPVAELTARFVGYETVVTRCQLEWLGGDFPEFVCRLVPLGAGLGTVFVQFDDPPQLGFRSADRPQEFGLLKLRNLADSPSADVLSLALRNVEPDGRFRVGGIPYGEYVARLTLSDGKFVHPRDQDGVPISVGPDPAHFIVPTEGLGSLTVELVDTEGNIYNGPATFELGAGKPEPLPDQEGFRIRGGRGFTKFLRGPYRFPLLPPNHYVVGLSSPTQPFEEARKGPIVVEVPRSGEASVSVRIQRRM